MVGYGPDPSECIRFVRDSVAVCVAGNHDLASAGAVDTSDFNPYAAKAIAWTRAHLTEEDRLYLAGLPPKAEQGPFTIVHGSPRDPVWEYITSTSVARDNFTAFQTPYCLVGHSHVPAAFSDASVFGKLLDPGRKGGISLGENRLILNPGAVGQPRDGDPRASYAVIDTEKGGFNLRRIDYDIGAVQARMKGQGLPGVLIDRLATGT